MAIYRAQSRRFFLRGATALIGIPFLESLLPRAAWAGGGIGNKPPVRYVQVVASEGMHWKFWYGMAGSNNGLAGLVGTTGVPGTGPMLAGNAGLHYAQLSKISGPLSTVFGTSFDSLRSKMNIMMGLDACSVGVPTHVTGLSTTASVDPGNGGPLYSLSADQAIARSSAMYPGGSPQGGTPFLALCPTRDGSTAAEKHFTFSFNGSATPLLSAPSAAIAQAFPTAASGSGGNAAAAAVAAQKLKIVDQVKSDYDRVSKSSRISHADQQTLTNFMGLLSDLQNSYGGGGAAIGTCSPPQAVDGEVGYAARIKRMMDITVAALACGSTNVAHLALVDHAFDSTPISGSFNGGTYHDTAMHSNAAGHVYSAGLQAYVTSVTQKAAALSYLLGQMNAIQESNGSLLDNSIVVYLGQMGAHGAHSYWGMPVVTAGGGGGAFQTGSFLDYSQRLNGLQVPSINFEYEGIADSSGGVHGKQFATGRPYNDLFTSIFQGLGIPPSDFTQPKNTQGGFGDYTGLSESNKQALSGNLAQRALPMFSKSA